MVLLTVASPLGFTLMAFIYGSHLHGHHPLPLCPSALHYKNIPRAA